MLRGSSLAPLAAGLLVLVCSMSALTCAVAQSPRQQQPAPEPLPGAIVGLITDAAGRPIAHATVTAIRADGRSIRAVVSGSDGSYSFADLPPGDWKVSVDVPGAQLPSVALQVTAGKAARYDFAAGNEARLAQGATTPAPATTAVTPAPATTAATPAPVTPPAATARAPATGPGAAPSYPPHATAANLSPQTGPKIPEALQEPEPSDNSAPFSWGDFTWLNGTPRNKQPVFDTKFFTPDVRLDVHYMQDLNGPKDHTIVGSTEAFRSGEFQAEQISVGGDFHWENVRARILYISGLFATTTPRNDASQAVGQWDLRNAYRYVSEANAGYHFDVNHGLNVDAGIFVSYIGLFSYYNFDNWTYQPSYVSSNTPWFFNGLRIQWYPTDRLKIEPWIINGWQSYARFNGHLGYGGQILYRPTDWLSLVFNNYGVGQDNLGLPHTVRVHTDDSIEVKYYENASNGWGPSKAAFSFTGDAGCQYGGGLHCTGGPNKSSFLGQMFYNRVWFDHDRYAITIGGGTMSNPGRYLTLLPPINGADAVSGTPYFTENPGQPIFQWDTSLNFQYMPRQWITWWAEAGYRHSSMPYFAGAGGVTPPGGNNGSPAFYTCNSGASAGTNDLSQATSACGDAGVWFPDLRKVERRLSAGVLVKF